MNEDLKDIFSGQDNISDTMRDEIAEKYKKLLSDIENKYPYPPRVEDIVAEEFKKKYKFNSGDIYEVKDGAKIWVIPLQYQLTYHRDYLGNPMYVRVTQWAWDNSCVFCYRVEKNMFGMLSWEDCELEIVFESLDTSKCYKEEEMVNKLPYMDYVYDISSTGTDSSAGDSPQVPKS